MTTTTQMIRKYMTLFEDLVIVHSQDAGREMHEESAWRIKGFARRTISEREAQMQIGQLLNQKKEIEESLRTWRQDFPQLFEDQKVSMK